MALRPSDYDKSGDIIPDAVNEDKGDLISREALKEEIVKLCERINANNGITVPTLAFTRIIDNAPTVESKQGEWINTSPYDDNGECSLCCYLSKKYYKFCPNCSVKMKGN